MYNVDELAKYKEIFSSKFMKLNTTAPAMQTEEPSACISVSVYIQDLFRSRNMMKLSTTEYYNLKIKQ